MDEALRIEVPKVPRGKGVGRGFPLLEV